MFYIFSVFGKIVYQTEFKSLIWLNWSRRIEIKSILEVRLTYKNKPRGVYARRGWEGGVKGKRKGRREQRLFLLSQKFFQCSIYLMYSSLLSVHFWSLHFVAFSRTNWSTQPALLPRNKRNKNLNASNLPLLWFLHGPIFLFFFEQGSVFPELFTGSGGIEFQITLRFVASWFLSAADPQPRLQFFRSRKTNRVAQAVSVHPWPWGLQTIVFSVSLSAAIILQDSLPSAPRFPRFPQIKPQYASPPTVVRLRMPEAELILVDVWPRWTRLICCLPTHTQAVQPSYSWAKLSRLVASLITKSTCSATDILLLGSTSRPSNLALTRFHTLTA